MTAKGRSHVKEDKCCCEIQKERDCDCLKHSHFSKNKNSNKRYNRKDLKEKSPCSKTRSLPPQATHGRETHSNKWEGKGGLQGAGQKASRGSQTFTMRRKGAHAAGPHQPQRMKPEAEQESPPTTGARKTDGSQG